MIISDLKAYWHIRKPQETSVCFSTAFNDADVWTCASNVLCAKSRELAHGHARPIERIDCATGKEDKNQVYKEKEENRLETRRGENIGGGKKFSWGVRIGKVVVS